jgi:hypothetical protein
LFFNDGWCRRLLPAFVLLLGLLLLLLLLGRFRGLCLRLRLPLLLFGLLRLGLPSFCRAGRSTVLGLDLDGGPFVVVAVVFGRVQFEEVEPRHELAPKVRADPTEAGAADELGVKDALHTLRVRVDPDHRTTEAKGDPEGIDVDHPVPERWGWVQQGRRHDSVVRKCVAAPQVGDGHLGRIFRRNIFSQRGHCSSKYSGSKDISVQHIQAVRIFQCTKYSVNKNIQCKISSQ